MRNLGNGHMVKCHLPEDVLAEMEPVIVLGGKNKKASPKPAAKKAKNVARKVSRKPAPRSSTKAAVAGIAAVAGTGSKSVSTKKKPVAKKDNAPPKIKKPAKPDDLKRISGVGPKLEGVLNGLGIYKFEQISKWKKAEREWVDGYLKFKGRIDRDNWVAQAKKLMKEK